MVATRNHHIQDTQQVTIALRLHCIYCSVRIIHVFITCNFVDGTLKSIQYSNISLTACSVFTLRTQFPTGIGSPWRRLYYAGSLIERRFRHVCYRLGGAYILIFPVMSNITYTGFECRIKNNRQIKLYTKISLKQTNYINIIVFFSMVLVCYLQ